MWTRFVDTYSGDGRSKREQWAIIYIEAREEDAIAAFIARFGHDPEDEEPFADPNYSIMEFQDLAQGTGFYRNCAFIEGRYTETLTSVWRGTVGLKLLSIDEYIKESGALFISATQLEAS